MLCIVPRIVLSRVNLLGVTQYLQYLIRVFLLPSAQRQLLTSEVFADWILVLIAEVNEFKCAEITASYSPNPSGNALCFLQL